MANQQTVRALHMNHDTTDASGDTVTVSTTSATTSTASPDQDVMNIGSAYQELMLNDGTMLGYAAVAIVLGDNWPHCCRHGTWRRQENW